jgi:hypothetical protein
MFAKLETRSIPTMNDNSAVVFGAGSFSIGLA